MNELCRKIRSEILTISHKSGHGHIPTSFSIVEMLCAVYQTMRHDPKRPDMPDRDLFVLSKGHASLGFYCVLAGHDYFDFEDVYAFGAFDSKFGCHPDRTKVPGAEASTGSLGHGIGLAVGMALAAKIAGTSRQVYTLIGDGESNEGTVWEAIMVATNLKLDNLTVLYDHNHSQGRCLPIPNPAERFRAFGCDVDRGRRPRRRRAQAGACHAHRPCPRHRRQHRQGLWLHHPGREHVRMASAFAEGGRAQQAAGGAACERSLRPR